MSDAKDTMSKPRVSKPSKEFKVEFPISIEIYWEDEPNPDISHFDASKPDEAKRIKRFKENKFKMLSLIVIAKCGDIKKQASRGNIASDFHSYHQELVDKCTNEAVAAVKEEAHRRLYMRPFVKIEENHAKISWKLPKT